MFQKVIAFTLFTLLLPPALSSCKDADSRPDYMKDPEKLASTTAKTIREDYLQYLIAQYGDSEWKLGEIWVAEYFGNYSGCEVVYMGCYLPYTEALRPVQIAGYTVVFRDGQEVYAYKDSHFYTVKEAYDAGLTTKSDVYLIGRQVGLGFTEQYPSP